MTTPSAAHLLASNPYLITSILSHLPLHSLLQCTLVCTSWTYTIRRSPFLKVKLFLHPSSLPPIPIFTIFCRGCGGTQLMPPESLGQRGVIQGEGYLPHPTMIRQCREWGEDCRMMVFDEREFGRLLKWEGGRGVKVVREMYLTQPPRKKVTVQYLKRKGNHLLGNNYEVLTEVKVEREGGLRWGDVVDEIKGDEGVRKCAMQQRRAFLKAVSDEKRWAEREATRKRTSGSIVSFLRNPFKHPFWRGYETEDILVGVQPEVGSGDETADAPPDPTAYGVFAATDVDLQPIYDRPCEWEGEVCIDCEYQMRTVVATL